MTKMNERWTFIGKFKKFLSILSFNKFKILIFISTKQLEPMAKKASKKKKVVKKAAPKKAAKKKSAPKKKAAKKKVAPKKKAVKKAVKKKAAPKKKAAKKKSARKPNAAFMAALTPSSALAEVIGSKPMPRTEMVKQIWVYIKKNGLQDSKNRRMINADAKLRPVFNGKSQISMFELAKVLSSHVK